MEAVHSYNPLERSLPDILSIDVQKKAQKFLGQGNKVMLTNAQQIINQQQNLAGKILVLDTRSRLQYHISHFENSISFPIDYCTDDFFINWNAKYVLDKILKNKTKKELFDKRKRMYVFIIASSNDISNYLDKLPRLYDFEALERYSKTFVEK